MIFRTLASVAMLILTASSAMAQDGEAPPSNSGVQPTDEKISAARDRADALIDAANAAGTFVNVTDGTVSKVEHAPSGMTCMLGQDPADRVHIFPVMSSGVAKGEDVACVSREDDAEFSVYATRYPNGMDTASIVANAVSGIQQRWPDAVDYDGPLLTARIEGVGTPQTAAFLVNIDGKEMFTLVSGLQLGEWSLKIRATGPAEDAVALSLQTTLRMSSAVLSIQD